MSALQGQQQLRAKSRKYCFTRQLHRLLQSITLLCCLVCAALFFSRKDCCHCSGQARIVHVQTQTTEQTVVFRTYLCNYGLLNDFKLCASAVLLPFPSAHSNKFRSPPEASLHQLHLATLASARASNLGFSLRNRASRCPN
jgi:hypothetical protein